MLKVISALFRNKCDERSVKGGWGGGGLPVRKLKERQEIQVRKVQFSLFLELRTLNQVRLFATVLGDVDEKRWR